MSCNSDSSSQLSGSPNELKAPPHMNDPPAEGFQLYDDEKEFGEFLDRMSHYYVPLPTSGLRSREHVREILSEEFEIKHNENLKTYNELKDEDREAWHNRSGYGVIWGGLKHKIFYVNYKGMDVTTDGYKQREKSNKRKERKEKVKCRERP